MKTINSDLINLKKNQKISAIKANELVPDAAKTLEFNYSKTSIDKEAARIGALSLGKSNAEWAAAWKGADPTSKMVNGIKVKLSQEEIQSTKAEWAINSTIESLTSGNLSKDLDINTADISLATTLSASIMMETLQRQSNYLSNAVKQGLHEMTRESALEGVKSLNKTEAEWASAWKGAPPTSKMVNGVTIDLTPAEIQSTKAEWAIIKLPVQLKIIKLWKN